MTDAVLLREKEPPAVIIKELMADCDNAMQVDCASQAVNFIVSGWFVFPKGSMTRSAEVTSAA